MCMNATFLRVGLFGIALIAMPKTALSDVYRVTLSKDSADHYQFFGGLEVNTQNCYANLYQSPVLLVVDEFATEDTLIIDANTRCRIVRIRLESWQGKQALQSQSRAKLYQIDEVSDSELLTIGNYTFEQDFFCGRWDRADELVLLNEQNWSGCSDTVAYNLTQDEACELHCK